MVFLVGEKGRWLAKSLYFVGGLFIGFMGSHIRVVTRDIFIWAERERGYWKQIPAADVNHGRYSLTTVSRRFSSRGRFFFFQIEIRCVVNSTVYYIY